MVVERRFRGLLGRPSVLGRELVLRRLMTPAFAAALLRGSEGSSWGVGGGVFAELAERQERDRDVAQRVDGVVARALQTELAELRPLPVEELLELLDWGSMLTLCELLAVLWLVSLAQLDAQQQQRLAQELGLPDLKSAC